MAVRQGYGKIAGTDALVFAYDTGDTRNSYKGEPTTNTVGQLNSFNPLDLYTWASNGNTSTWSRDATAPLSPAKGIPLKEISSGTDSYSGTYNNTVNNISTASSGQTWTVSVYALATAGTNIQVWIFGANSSGNYIELNVNSFTATGVWQRISVTMTFTNGSTAAVQARVATATNGGVIWWDGLQTEQKSYATQFTTGTRSATQGLKDLTAANTINLSNVSFDSNAQMTFDGTNDLIDVSYYSTVNNSLSRSWEVVVRPTTSLTYAGIFGHKIGYGCSYYCNGGIYLWYGNWSFNWYDNAAYQFLDSSVAATANAYAHIVGTYDASDQKPRIYVNGQLRATYGSSTNMNYGGETYVLDIGWNSKDGGQHYLQGQIPVAKYYSNKALTADEVRNNYNQYRTRFNI